MIYAILNETQDKVENVAESYIPLNANWIQVAANVPVAIGDSYDGKSFYSPSGEMRMSYINQNIQDQVNQSRTQIIDLETAFDALMGGVSVALGL